MGPEIYSAYANGMSVWEPGQEYDSMQPYLLIAFLAAGPLLRPVKIILHGQANVWNNLHDSTCGNLVNLVTSSCAGGRTVGERRDIVLCRRAHCGNCSWRTPLAGRLRCRAHIHLGSCGAPGPCAAARQPRARRLRAAAGASAHACLHFCTAWGAEQGRPACVCCAACVCTVRAGRLQTCMEIGAGLCCF